MPSRQKTWRLARALGPALHATRGDVAVEYVFLLGTVALPLVPAFLAIARAMIRDFEQMRALLLLPLP